MTAMFNPHIAGATACRVLSMVLILRSLADWRAVHGSFTEAAVSQRTVQGADSETAGTVGAAVAIQRSRGFHKHVKLAY